MIKSFIAFVVNEGKVTQEVKELPQYYSSRWWGQSADGAEHNNQNICS